MAFLNSIYCFWVLDLTDTPVRYFPVILYYKYLLENKLKKILKETTNWICSIEDSPKPPPQRVTVSLPVLNNAKNVAFLVTGKNKAPVLKVCTAKIIYIIQIYRRKGFMQRLFS